MKYLMLTLIVAAAAIAAPALHSSAANVPPATQDFIDKASVANTFEIHYCGITLEPRRPGLSFLGWKANWPSL